MGTRRFFFEGTSGAELRARNPRSRQFHADFTGVTFSGNAGGEIIDCDSSSWMVSDLARSSSALAAAGVACKTPHALGNRDVFKSVPTPPDWSGHKALFDKYAKVAVKH